MNSLYIYHQTNIGDHILCYPIVKYYANKYDQIRVLAYEKGYNHSSNLQRLYSSLPNVKVMYFQHHKDVLFFISLNQLNKYLIIGHEDYRQALLKDPNLQFDKYFYERAEVPFENKWNEFYFKRDIEKEKHVFYNVLNCKDNKPFIFLQEDSTRNLLINRKYINNSITVIETAEFPDISIFDFLYTIEKAKEVHEINSSFLTFIDMMQIKHDNLFYHKYVRPTEYEQPHLKLNWKIIEE
jgi:hypothetical protein